MVLRKDAKCLSFCLREIANNIDKTGFHGMRIGACVLTFEFGGYDVTAWDGTKNRYADLVDAIGRFIDAVNMAK